MSVSLSISCRVVRGRVVIRVGDAPPRVIGRVVRCPCCGLVRVLEG